MQRAAQDFHTLAEPWRKPVAEIEAFIASCDLNAKLPTTKKRDRELWADLALQLRGALECADAAMALAKGDTAYWETGDEAALGEAADMLA